MTKDQINAILLGLFASSGPFAKLLAALFKLDSALIDAILSVCTVLTPLVAGGVFAYLQRPSGAVASVASLSGDAQQAALAKVPDTAKVLIAKAVPGVATVVVKDNANGALAQLAQDEAQPDIVTETQNEIDAKKGTKT